MVHVNERLRENATVETEYPLITGQVQMATYMIEMRDTDAAQRERVLEQVRRILDESGLGARLVPLPSVGAKMPPAQDGQSHHRAVLRGEARLVQWIENGVLVNGSALEQAWGLTRQALDAARKRGDLFSLWIKNQHWYPADFLKFEREALAEISHALGDIDPTDKLLFLLREHGALGGMRPDAAVEDRMADVLRLAAAWGRA